ncbi:putative family c-likeg-protein-coupled receptor protein [Trichophyton interdigitale]|nr:putative family c-likeg-protein-coupled receptor protein [Trichophyton interdigitale]
MMSRSLDMAHGLPGKPGIEAHGPPYPPSGAGLGGRPTLSVDVAISAVFISIFLAGAVSSFTIFRKNLQRNHKFIPSAATGGYCIARIVANTLRIVWAAKPMNINVAIAAQVFIAAGVLILFVINLIFAQRMLRASHPAVGWSRPVSYAFKILYILIGLTLVTVITATVQSFFTLDPNTRRIDRDLQLFGGSLLTFVAFLPIPILAFIHLAPRRQPRDQFGSGSWSAKVIIVTATAVLLTLGAGFRIGVSASPIRAATNPAWYHHKACFYIFNFVLEAMVVYMFLFGRVNRRFFVPNGSSKVRNYSDNRTEPKTSDNDEEGQGQVVMS